MSTALPNAPSPTSVRPWAPSASGRRPRPDTPGAPASVQAGRRRSVHNVELFIALLAGVVGLVWLAGPLRVPYPVVLVLGGLAVGLLPFLPNIHMEPDFVLLAFLPPILYRAAWTFAAEDLRMQW